jgi:hypothetical protein
MCHARSRAFSTFGFSRNHAMRWLKPNREKAGKPA